MDYARNKSKYNRFGLVIINDKFFFSDSLTVCVVLAREKSHFCRDNKVFSLNLRNQTFPSEFKRE